MAGFGLAAAETATMGWRGKLTTAALGLAVVATASCGTDDGAEPEETPATEEAAEPVEEEDREQPEPDEAGPEEDEPDDAEPEPIASSDDPCGTLDALLSSWDQIGVAFFSDSGALESAALGFVDGFPAVRAAAEGAAPAEVAEDLALVTEALAGIHAGLVGADLSDGDAIAAVLFDTFEADGAEDVDAAFQRLADHLDDRCAGSGPDEGVDALSDPCGLVDAATVAAAAGVEGAWEAGRSANSFEFPGLSSIQCVYDSDAVTLTIEVISYADLTATRGMYADNAHAVVDGVDLGALPDSTLLTRSDGEPALQAIYVFEAPTPFGIHLFPSVADPADLVAAAEVVLAGQS